MTLLEPGAPRRAAVLGVGLALPDRVVTNRDMEAIVDTSDEWIFARTGIRQRHVVSDGETTAGLGAEAARLALADAGVDASEIDLVLCATCSGDYLWPATACLIQEAIGASESGAFDLSAACSGFCYGLSVASGMIANGTVRRALVVGAESMTRHVDWTDRATCVLFGDGAGAVVMGDGQPDHGVISSVLKADGSRFGALLVPAGGTKTPLTHELLDSRQNCLRMNGSEVFKFAVRIMGEICLEALERAGLRAEDVDLFVPHQANIRIIDAAAQRMGLGPSRVYTNVDRYGNTGAASIPIALAEASRAGRLSDGDIVVTVGFGAGLTWGANVVRWGR